MLDKAPLKMRMCSFRGKTPKRVYVSTAMYLIFGGANS